FFYSKVLQAFYHIKLIVKLVHLQSYVKLFMIIINDNTNTIKNFWILKLFFALWENIFISEKFAVLAKKKKVKDKKREEKKKINICLQNKIDLISLMELLLLAAIKSESKDAIDKMLELNVTDQKFLMHILEDLMSQNGFVELSSANGTTYNRNIANSLSHLDHSNNTPIINTVNKMESLTMTIAMQIPSEDKSIKDLQWQSFAQLSTRHYDKSQRLYIQNPFGRKKSDLLLFQRHQQQLIFDFDFDPFNANKSPFAVAFSTRQHKITPYHQRWNTQHLATPFALRRKYPTVYQLLQIDFEKLDINFKQLSTQYFQLKQEHQLQEKVQTNASGDFQKNE
ncbi:hypothetical protein RFI_37419, partial [Reticulomyxa filosa]